MYDPLDDQILLLIDKGSPTVREIGKQLGLRSPASVQERLNRLREKEMITWEEGQHRSRKLTTIGKRYLEANYG